jgi:glycerophosphoryl diester phosphodiesterase
VSDISMHVTGPEHPHPTDHRPLVIAHRGSSAAFAENTRAAFLHALAEGADGVEVDVHLSRDRHLVCLHDPTLERTSNGSGAVSDHTLAQLRRLDFHSWKGARLPGEYGPASAQLLTLPELVGLLAEAGRPVRLALEFKHPSPFGHELEERALSWLLQAGWDPETSRIGAVEVSFMSFYAGSMQYLAPVVDTDHLCQLVSTVPSEPVASRFGLGPLSRAAVRATLHQAVADAERLIWEGRTGMAGPGVDYVRHHLADVKAWIATGRILRVWTADRPEDVELLRAVGVQEITTNLPGPVLAQVAGRGVAVPAYAGS